MNNKDLVCTITEGNETKTIDIEAITKLDINTPIKKEMTISNCAKDKEDSSGIFREDNHRLYNSLLTGVSKSREEKVSHFKSTKNNSKRSKLPKIDDSINVTSGKRTKRKNAGTQDKEQKQSFNTWNNVKEQKDAA